MKQFIILLSFIFICLNNKAQIPTTCFNSPVNLQSGGAGQSVNAKDFNHDGILDLVNVNNVPGQSSVAILLGIGNGGFLPAVNYTLSATTTEVTISDFNNDGNFDIAVAHGNSSFISILIGSATGTFTFVGNYGVDQYPESITSADFNGDGNFDIAVACFSGYISILLGNGDGTFLPQIYAAAGSGPYSVITSDFNSDGKSDLAVTNINSDNLSILFGIGTGTFALPVNYLTGLNPYACTCADFNYDGNIDLAVVNQQSDDVNIFLGSASGLFTSAGTYTVEATPWDIKSGDFNNDGLIDLVTLCSGAGKIKFLLGVGTGTFVSGASIGGTYGVSILAADLNADSKVDLVNTDGGNVLMVRINGIPTIFLTAPNSICYGNYANLIASGLFYYSWSTGAITNSISVNPLINTTYTLTGYSNTGCSGTIVKTISVTPTPSLIISNGTICIGSSNVIGVTGAMTYTWSTGQTTSSITVNPTVTTIYTVTGTDMNGCINSQTISVTVDNTCADVWPGDANSDGTADNLDILELGLHYTQTGVPRAAMSNNWQSYFANNWTGTITNGKNLNHSDCNGDGIIDDNDTLVIYNNYGLTHAFKPAQTTTVNPQLSIVPDQAMVTKGNWGTASVYLGDATTSINNINGIAFTVDFDNTLIESNSIYIEYQNSFIDAGQNLHFQKQDFANGKVYTATTHTVNNNVYGYGKIAILHYQISSTLTTDQTLTLGVSQVNQSNASGVISPLTSGTGTLMAIGASVGVKENNFSGNVLISPNPTNGILNISFSVISQNTKIEIYNTVGALVMSENLINKTSTINISDLSNGMYFMKVLEGNKVVAVKKVIKE